MDRFRKNQALLGYGALFVAAMIFSLYGVFIRQQSTSFSAFGQLDARNLLALLLTIIIATVRGKWCLPRGRRTWLVLLIFAVASAAYPFLFTFGALHTQASSIVVMLYAGGIGTALLAGKYVFRERLTRPKRLALVTVAIGLAVFGWPYHFYAATILGLLAGFGSGIFDATVNTIRKYLGDIPREMLLFWSLTISVASMTLGVLVERGPAITHPLQPATWVVLGWHAISIVVLGYLMVFAVKRVDINAGTMVLPAEILMAYIVNGIFLHEHPTPMQAIGALLVFVASLVMPAYAFWRHRQSRSADTFVA